MQLQAPTLSSPKDKLSSHQPEKQDPTSSRSNIVSGRLEDYPLIDLLQAFSRDGRSGKLNLSHRDGQGLVVFHQGKIVYTASSSIRETLGSVLVAQRLITSDQLAQALEFQHSKAPERKLGAILIELGLLEASVLRSVVRSEIELVLAELLQWDTGYFRFRPTQQSTPSDVEVDAGDFLLGEGLPASRVSLAGKIAPEAIVVSPQLTQLLEVTKDGHHAEFRAELTHEILGEAEQRLDRGILFLVRLDGFYGSSHFGFDEAPEMDARIRRMRLPLHQPSLLRQVGETQEIYLGPLDDQRWNRFLVDELGGQWPAAAIAIPMVVGHRALSVFYGDNATSGRPITAVAPLGLLMAEASLALERETLQKREERFEKLRAEIAAHE